MRKPSVALSVAAALIAACGGGETSNDDAPDETAAVAAAEPQPSDPCSLIPIAQWEAATGYTDIRPDRSAGNTCDFLSDDLWGVVGSVIFPGRAMMERPPAMAGGTDPIEGLGDEALWLSMGPIVRVGDRVVWVTVNPSVENQRDVAIRLARIAIAGL